MGTDKRQPSPNPGILFLKLPATMLQTSPRASETSRLPSTASIPIILEAISVADLAAQATVIVPHNFPAKPTMEVVSQHPSTASSDTANWQPIILSKTSRVANSINGSHSSCWPFAQAGSFSGFMVVPAACSGFIGLLCDLSAQEWSDLSWAGEIRIPRGSNTDRGISRVSSTL